MRQVWDFVSTLRSKKMHRNAIWLGFLGILLLVVLIFVGSTAHSLYIYSRMLEKAAPTELSWEVKELSGGKHILVAHYAFSVNGTIYTGITDFKHTLYFNPWTAEAARDHKEQEQWTVWYDLRYPGSRSTIEKIFPTKKCIYSGIVIAILLYFIGLGIYVNKRYL